MCDDCTDLTDAIKEQNFEEVKRLIEVEKVNINEKVKDGETPLSIAWDGAPEIVKYLLEHGADPLLPNDNNDFPFGYEIEKKVRKYAIKLMLKEVEKEMNEEKK